ncbi:hypothetical protein PV794_11580 [Comamonas aquatica]|nr:hypothetical protein [Comamonas aquatica]
MVFETPAPHRHSPLIHSTFNHCFSGAAVFSFHHTKYFGFFAKNRNYREFIPINAVFLQQLMQLRPVHSLQLSANRCTLHTKAKAR